MTTTATLMTVDKAREFRAEYGAQVVRLSRMSKTALAIEERRLMAAQNVQRVFGGPVLKDEFISSVLELRGYTTGRLNEATHVIGHQDTAWDGCRHCNGSAS